LNLKGEKRNRKNGTPTKIKNVLCLKVKTYLRLLKCYFYESFSQRRKVIKTCNETTQKATMRLALQM
jgi:hypothetical protein